MGVSLTVAQAQHLEAVEVEPGASQVPGGLEVVAGITLAIRLQVEPEQLPQTAQQVPQGWQP